MNLDSYKKPIQLRCGISIFPSQDRAMDRILMELLETAPARFTLLTDISGQIVSASGDRGKVNLVSLGALAASDLAASQEIARISGEYQENQLIIREGSKYHTITCEAGAHLILLTQVSNDVPLGWVRMLIRKTADRIVDVLRSDPEEDVSDVLQRFSNVDMSNVVDDLLGDAWLG